MGLALGCLITEERGDLTMSQLKKASEAGDLLAAVKKELLPHVWAVWFIAAPSFFLLWQKAGLLKLKLSLLATLLLASVVLLGVYVSRFSKAWRRSRLQARRKGERLEALRSLSREEWSLLADLVRADQRSFHADILSPVMRVAQSLSQRGILVPAGSGLGGIPYQVQPWAWELLSFLPGEVCPTLLAHYEPLLLTQGEEQPRLPPRPSAPRRYRPTSRPRV